MRFSPQILQHAYIKGSPKVARTNFSWQGLLHINVVVTARGCSRFTLSTRTYSNCERERAMWLRSEREGASLRRVISIHKLAVGGFYVLWSSKVRWGIKEMKEKWAMRCGERTPLVAKLPSSLRVLINSL